MTLNATGTDTDVARFAIGLGGVFAGSGGEAHTSDTSDVSALIGANAVIDAGAVTISATHTDDYAAELDALNASAVDAPASPVMDNEANSTVAITLGSGVTIMSSDTFDPTSNSIAANAVAMTASNNFSDDFAGSPHNTLQAAGGGAVQRLRRRQHDQPHRRVNRDVHRSGQCFGRQRRRRHSGAGATSPTTTTPWSPSTPAARLRAPGVSDSVSCQPHQ